MAVEEHMDAGSTSFFRVALACEAAPHIGCGPIARPVLEALEQQPGVQQVRLNRAGTILGVVWKRGSADPRKVIDALARRGLAGTEVDSHERPRMFNSFADGAGWHRAMDLQELSAEEAGVIAARLVRRLRQRVDLPADTTERLMRRLEQQCAIALENGGAAAMGIQALREHVAAALLDAGSGILDQAACRAFEAVVALGHRPLPGED